MGNTEEYMDVKYGVKSVKTLVKWIKKEILNRKLNVDCDCVKVDSYVYIYWAIDSKLHKYAISTPVIYCLKVADAEMALNEIEKTLKK